MQVAPAALASVMETLHRVQNVGGFLVTVPHKPAALSLCASATDRAKFVGSANVVVRTAKGWHGDNTDGAGYLDGIARQKFSVLGKRALLSVVSKLSQRFPGRVSAGGQDPSGFNLIANATPMGMNDADPLPVDVSKLEASQFVACVVTKPEIPPLIAEARSRGCQTMTGKGMFEAQAETLADFLLQETPPLKRSA